MSTKRPSFKELPITQLEADNEQPRRDFEVKENDRLVLSIKNWGIQEPIAVYAKGEDRFIILDGHRRYRSAQVLKQDIVPCKIYSNLATWEQEFLRFELQNNRKNWQPMERANSLHRIMQGKKFKKNAELAEFVHLSTSTVSYSLSMRNQKVENVEIFQQFKLTDAYITEYLRLKPKLRKIKDIEINQVTITLFEKVENHGIKTAKDFRTLQPIFLRGEHFKDFLHEFLTDKDMTVDELEERTQKFGPSIAARQLVQELGSLLSSGRMPPADEIPVFKELGDLCDLILQKNKS